MFFFYVTGLGKSKSAAKATKATKSTKKATESEIDNYLQADFECEQWKYYVTQLEDTLKTLATAYRVGKRKVWLLLTHY